MFYEHEYVFNAIILYLYFHLQQQDFG